MNNVGIFWLDTRFKHWSCAPMLRPGGYGPSLTKLPRDSALAQLIFVHAFRYVGMTSY